jgi:circadian clock protein KaiC
VSKIATQKNNVERVKSGINGLDKLIEGGFVKNSVVLVQGNTGTNKTIFCLQYLINGAIEYNEPGVFISFAEPKESIIQHGKSFGWEIEELEKKGLFAFVKYAPHEVANIMREGGGSIRDTIESIGAKRLIIDSLTAYALFFENKYKANESVLELFELLRNWKITSLVTAEVPIDISRKREASLGFLTDGIINLYHTRKNNQVIKAIEVIKMRDTHHNEDINLFEVEKSGIRIVGDLNESKKNLAKGREESADKH